MESTESRNLKRNKLKLKFLLMARNRQSQKERIGTQISVVFTTSGNLTWLLNLRVSKSLRFLRGAITVTL